MESSARSWGCWSRWAGWSLIFATGGIGIPIGILLIIGVLAAGLLRSRRSTPDGAPGPGTRTARPGRPLTTDDDAAFVGTGEPSDPLSREPANDARS